MFVIFFPCTMLMYPLNSQLYSERKKVNIFHKLGQPLQGFSGLEIETKEKRALPDVKMQMGLLSKNSLSTRDFN